MYDVIAKVCKPHKPGAKSYDEIIELVKKHLKPQASHLVNCSNFRQRVQKDNTSISDYVAELKDLANDCKFDNLEDQVLDQLISGLKNKSVVAELLKIDEPTLKVALKKSLATDAANKGAEKLQEASKADSGEAEITDSIEAGVENKDSNINIRADKHHQEQCRGLRRNQLHIQGIRRIAIVVADITLMNHDESLYESVGMLKRVKEEANGNTIWTDVYVTKSKGPAIIALKKDVENEIDRLVGQLVPVDNSEWATPIVPILKPNGKLRMCADFKVTVNPQLVTMRYPAPNFDHAIAKLQGRAKYTKIDCADAYLQVPVDEESQKLLTINTHKGLYRYKYLVFGISSAPGIFQKFMEEAIKNIPKAAIVADYIVVTGDTPKEHLEILDRVLTILTKCGLKAPTEKCDFYKDKVTYLGNEISQKRIGIDSKIYQAIVEMKTPTCKKDVQLLLGKINYYKRLFKKRAEILAPLYDCNYNDEFVWNEECKIAFEQVKLALKQSVVNYDPNLPLILTCNASPQGLAAFISQPYSDDISDIVTAKQEMQIKNYIGNRTDKFNVSDIIIARDFRKYHDKMSEAEIVKVLSPHNYSIKFKEGEGVHKRHGNQLRAWGEQKLQENVKVVIDKSSTENCDLSNEQNPLYVRRSTRQSKAVQRYCANVRSIKFQIKASWFDYLVLQKVGTQSS
ncbi:uncharacterized protein LOC111643461 [Copidosoma floridanum]|uniref:uncharacterized protein LOC111643461 n=1 Tax=Copidosoma floridanum TaxID=29053 RepID=UPI000C6F736F|nr:uncharacterized protein LOC111643461 [Copidosoma floridanum]